MIKRLIEAFYIRKGPHKVKSLLAFVVVVLVAMRAGRLHDAGEPWLSNELAALGSLTALALFIRIIVLWGKKDEGSLPKAIGLSALAAIVVFGAWYLLSLQTAMQVTSENSVLMAIYLTLLGVGGLWVIYKRSHREAEVEIPDLSWLDRDRTDEGVQGELTRRQRRRFMKERQGESVEETIPADNTHADEGVRPQDTPASPHPNADFLDGLRARIRASEAQPE